MAGCMAISVTSASVLGEHYVNEVVAYVKTKILNVFVG